MVRFFFLFIYVLWLVSLCLLIIGLDDSLIRPCFYPRSRFTLRQCFFENAWFTPSTCYVHGVRFTQTAMLFRFFWFTLSTCYVHGLRLTQSKCCFRHVWFASLPRCILVVRLAPSPSQYFSSVTHSFDLLFSRSQVLSHLYHYK